MIALIREPADLIVAESILKDGVSSDRALRFYVWILYNKRE